MKEDWIATQTEDENKQISKYWSSIMDSYGNTEITKFITGKNPMSDWDKFIAKLKDLGIEDLIKIYDTGYRRTYNIK